MIPHCFKSISSCNHPAGSVGGRLFTRKGYEDKQYLTSSCLVFAIIGRSMEIYLLLSIALFISSANSVKVSTPLGDLLGKVVDDESISFLAVPYAEAPTGDLRFQEPRSPTKWNGTRDATKNGPSCIQSSPILGLHNKISEDCLTLDIYVDGKSINKTSKMPVLVFIHGGSFVSGSSIDYNLSKFVAGKGVVAVAIQYRLGLLGFAQSPDEKVIPGNNGLKDQVAALKWVKKYINNFGGDGEQVTVAGESAGSISIAYHLVSPLATKTMKRAILESGAHKTLPVLNAQQVETNMRQVIYQTECARKARDEQFECLKSVPVDKLQAIVQRLNGRASFTPTIDSKFFAKQDPAVQVESGNFTTKLDALIVGQNGNEGALFLALYAKQIFPLTGYPRRKLWYAFELRAATPLLPRMARATWNRIVTQTYKGRFAMNETDLANTMGKVLGDELFACGNFNFTEAYIKANPKTKVYYYDFLPRPMKPGARLIMPYIRDALHADEIPFVYGRPLLNETAFTPDEVEFSKRLINEWTTFVKKGSVADKKWPRVQIDQGEVKPSHVVFVNSVNTEYRLGFPQNECKRLKTAPRFSVF